MNTIYNDRREYNMEDGGQYSELRQARERKGWSLEEVAEKIGVSRQTVHRWETKKATPSNDHCSELCKLFGMTAKELGLISDRDPVPNDDEEVQHPEDYQHSSETSDLSARSTASYSKRQHFLEKVRKKWIEDVLEQSLSGTVHLTLELRDYPKAITDARETVMHLPDRPIRHFPPGIHITQIYDKACGELLLLGEPGAGKSTLLLELDRDLLQRAFEDEKHPLPFVFKLSSWSEKRAPLTSWLVEELNVRYQVPRHVAQEWVRDNHIIPLLDGLDEVSSTFRDACVEAITAYHQEHGFAPLVVCSRQKEYMALAERLQLQQAVCIQPITQQQIDEYLEIAGEQAEELRLALRDDKSLQELVANPLMLLILVSAYRSRSIEDLKESMTIEQRRKQLFTAYIEGMFKRGTPKYKQLYTEEQCKRGLTYLARQMRRHHNRTDFYLEEMQLDWLPPGLWRPCYGLFIGLWAGLLIALLIGLMSLALGGTLFGTFVVTPCISISFGLIADIVGTMVESEYSTPIQKISIGVIAGVDVGYGIIWMGNMYPPFNNIRAGTAAGLVIALAFLLLSIIEPGIQVAEPVSWSWRQIAQNLPPLYV